MEDDFKPIVQPWRRLYPKVQDMVKKEIIKLLDAKLIYAISDSPWVSPIHVVPKKGGMTVITNENNKLVPTRTVTSKQDAKPRIIRWVLLLQEFTIEIKDKKGTENLAVDHLSRIENQGLEELREDAIHDSFPDKHLCNPCPFRF
ncbi:hypothetical protein Tco_0373175 [Tanacetum coccineum]